MGPGREDTGWCSRVCVESARRKIMTKRPRTLTERIPKIVCLCGSTRFYKEYMIANFLETMIGNIVLSVGFFANAKESDWKLRHHGQNVGITPVEKARLDELHMRKIDLCDEVLVIDVGGYIGESTKNEILYATELGIPIRNWHDEKRAGEIYGILFDENEQVTVNNK
jgi:hypothetical protein